MKKQNNKFIVPKKDQKKFDRLIQRANRRIQANLKYIAEENKAREDQGLRPLSKTAVTALVGDYWDENERATSKTVFSRSKTFESQKDYKQFLRHVNEWGKKKGYERDQEAIRKGYVKAVIGSLTTVAANTGAPILTKSGRLPANIAKEIREMSLEQLTHYFKEADPSEDLEYEAYQAKDYISVSSRESFIDVTKSRLNQLKSIYPSPALPKQPKKLKKKRNKKPKIKK